MHKNITYNKGREVMMNKKGLGNVLKSLSLVSWVFVMMAGGLSCLAPSVLWAEEVASSKTTYEKIEEPGNFPVFVEKEIDPEQPKENKQHGHTVTGSSVDHRNRTYTTEGPSLSSQVPGGAASLGLSYENGTWTLGSARSSLKGLSSESGGLQFNEVCQEYGTPIITAIMKDGKYGYNLPPDNMRKVTEYDAFGNIESEKCEYVGEQIYLHEGKEMTYVIRPVAGGYRWEDKYGNWKLYAGKDSGGRMLSVGDRRGTTEQAIYDVESRIVGYSDQTDAQIFWIEYDADTGLIFAIRDAAERQVEYSYYPDGKLNTVKDEWGYVTTYNYNVEGKLAKIIEPDGQEVNITYNNYGHVISVLDAEDQGYFFEYDYDKNKEEYYALVKSTSGLIKEYWYDKEGDTKRIDINGTTVQAFEKDGSALIIKDEYGRVTRNEYDEWDNLTKEVYPDGSIVSYEYGHPYNQLIKMNDRGIVTKFEYDDNGRTTTLIEAADTVFERITEYEYDDEGRMSRLIEAAGSDVERVTEYAYAPDGNLTTIREYLDEGLIALTMAEYDDSGRMSKVIDPVGHETLYTYDDMGNLQTVEDVTGVEHYDYDDMGRLHSTTDQFGNITVWEYDTAGNIIHITVNGKTDMAFVYNDNGDLVQLTDREDSLQFEYNADGQISRTVDSEGKILAQYEYDSDGRLIKDTDENDMETRMEDGDMQESPSFCPSCSEESSGGGRFQRIIYPTFTKEYRYDAWGRIIEEKDVVSETESYFVQFTYDPFGNILSETDKAGNTTTYHYDTLGRQIMITDPFGQTTQYNYNKTDELLALTDAQGNVTQFEYDIMGRLVKKIRPMLQETTYEYNEMGQIVKTVDAKNQTTEFIYNAAGELIQITYFDGKIITFAYTDAGLLESYSDGSISVTYTYDAMHRKTKERVDYGPFAKEFTYSYYGNGLKQSFTGPDGIMYEYLYGDNNELRELRIPDKGTITLSSYLWYQPLTVAFPNGSTQEYTYDPFMRFSSIITKDPGQNLVMKYQYTYDSMDNILSKTTEHGEYTYGYDKLYRLIQADTPPVQDAEAFTYDAVGNRLTTSGVEGPWTYNRNNELLSISDNVEYDYDENGNLIQIRTGDQVVFSYIYNAENRLVRVEDGSGAVIATYYYDHFGRRLWKEVSGVRTYFLYSDEGLVAEYDMNGNELRTYHYQPDSTWMTDPLFMRQGSHYYFYQNDHLGTPMKLIGGNGAVVWSAQYQSFGKATPDASSTVTNNLRFPGQYYDTETGLHYNWKRYYDPETGRYLRVDPLGLDGGDVNFYGYSKNNPVNVVDPYGLWAFLHEPLTEISFLTASFRLPRSCRNLVYINLVIGNLRQDTDPYKYDLKRHYNRGREESYKKAKKDYAMHLWKTFQSFKQDLASARIAPLPVTCQLCKRAIINLGTLTHSWQDYYGHAVLLNGKPSPAWGRKLPISGNPDHQHRYLKPSSYIGEHKKFWEPAWHRGEFGKRVVGAIRFVTKKYFKYFPEWASACQCCCKKKRLPTDPTKPPGKPRLPPFPLPIPDLPRLPLPRPPIPLPPAG